MDRDRIIALVEAEIMRNVNRAKLCGIAEATEHLEVAAALTAALEAYRKATDWTQSRKIILPVTLPGLNDYITAERSHRQSGAAMKRKWQRDVALVMRRQLRRPLREPVIMRYTWVEKNQRRDKDNISSFGRKIIQDALVKELKALRNDGWANIDSFSDRFMVDKSQPRIELEIVEADSP